MSFSTILIILGILLIVFGLSFAGKLGPLGKLPGDVSVSRPGFTFYAPIATSIVLSVLLTLVLWIVRKVL